MEVEAAGHGAVRRLSALEAVQVDLWRAHH